MQGDFTRWTYRRVNNYSALWLQQGRCLMDADWNEQREIDRTTLRTLAKDLIGPAAGPIGESGFAVEVVLEDGEDKIYLRAGRYYVDGILCELHADVQLT